MKTNKKKLFLVMVLLLGLVGFLLGCGVSHKDLEKIGVLGEYQLRHIERTTGGNSYGSFFLGIGSVSGNTGDRLRFYWGRTLDEIMPTTLPYNLFRFIIDESKKVPTVRFVFDESLLSVTDSVDYVSKAMKENPGWLFSEESVKRGYILSVVIKISQETLEKEVYLPH